MQQLPLSTVHGSSILANAWHSEAEQICWHYYLLVNLNQMQKRKPVLPENEFAEFQSQSNRGIKNYIQKLSRLETVLGKITRM